MSTATRRQSIAFMARMAAAAGPVTSERSPVPNTASTITSAPARYVRQVVASSSNEASRTSAPGNASKTREKTAASPVIFSRGMAKKTCT